MDIYNVGKVQSTTDQRLGVIRHGFNIIGAQGHPIVSIAFESKEEADAALPAHAQNFIILMLLAPGQEEIHYPDTPAQRRAARDAVRLFGKTEAEIDHIIAARMADSTLVVPSPINGRITARTAAPGLFVQPGSAPPPYVVADIDTMWMLANVAETDSPAFRIGQQVQVRLDAFPDRVFDGKITTIGAMVDPNTRRVPVRSEIKDPQHELRSGMFGNFVISIGPPLRSPAVPLAGVVREGDGTQTVWITADRRRFTKRTVKIGQPRDGYRQILEGLQVGELVATDGAVFLSNMLTIARIR